KNEIGNKNEVQKCNYCKCKLSSSRSASWEGRCSLKSWVFKSFLKVERDAPALVVLSSSFHQRGTTNENSRLPYLHRRQCQTTLTRRAQHSGVVLLFIL